MRCSQRDLEGGHSWNTGYAALGFLLLPRTWRYYALMITGTGNRRRINSRRGAQLGQQTSSGSPARPFVKLPVCKQDVT